MTKSFKIFIVLDILITIAVVCYFVGKSDRSTASIPEHKKAFLESNIKNYDKPRASIRLSADRVERTEHETFIFRVRVIPATDDAREVQFVWHLPDSARVFNGDANGLLILDESNLLELEVGLDDPNVLTDVNLEVTYERNGIKLGGVKNFQLNKPEENKDKFERAKAAFQETLEDSHQKIMQ